MIIAVRSTSTGRHVLISGSTMVWFEVSPIGFEDYDTDADSAESFVSQTPSPEL